MKRVQGDASAYSVEAVSRACTVLRAFRHESEMLRLPEVVARAGLPKVTVYRLLRTLEANGMVEHAGSQGYRSRVKIIEWRPWKIGYAGQSSEFAFSREVTDSLRRAAEVERLTLISLDNRYSGRVALKNVEHLLREKVNLIIEFQTDEHVAPIISSKCLEAGVPLIAIEIPHPGATFFGANNYAAGLIGGRWLGRWAKRHWNGHVDTVLLLELSMAGPLPASRLTGALHGLREVLPHFDDRRALRMNGNGQFGHTLELVRKWLRVSRSERTLVVAINDPSAVGALRAFEEAGRRDHCAVLGQNASDEARAEMRRPGTRLIASVGYFPERYGEEVVSLALDILQQKPAPPAVFIRNQLITPENVNHYYPNDRAMSPEQIDTLLLAPSRAVTAS